MRVKAAVRHSIRKNIKPFCVILFTVASVLFLGHVKSYAGTAASFKGEHEKIFISTVISEGHDIYDIAYENMPEGEDDVDLYISEVCVINHIAEPEKLDNGNHIIVPSYR